MPDNIAHWWSSRMAPKHLKKVWVEKLWIARTDRYTCSGRSAIKLNMFGSVECMRIQFPICQVFWLVNRDSGKVDERWGRDKIIASNSKNGSIWIPTISVSCGQSTGWIYMECAPRYYWILNGGRELQQDAENNNERLHLRLWFRLSIDRAGRGKCQVFELISCTSWNPGPLVIRGIGCGETVYCPADLALVPRIKVNTARQFTRKPGIPCILRWTKTHNTEYLSSAQNKQLTILGISSLSLVIE